MAASKNFNYFTFPLSEKLSILCDGGAFKKCEYRLAFVLVSKLNIFPFKEEDEPDTRTAGSAGLKTKRE